MRIIVLLIILFISNVASGQSIRFQENNITLEDALLTFAERQNLNILFKSDYFKKELLDFEVNASNLKDAITQILKDRSIKIKIDGNQVQLIRLRRIHGYIVDDENSEPLIYANVIDPITGRGTSTNEYGFFSFDSDYSSKEIQISYLGYKKEIQALSKDETALSIRLKNETTFEEVIVDENGNGNDHHYYRLGKERNILKNHLEQRSAIGGEPDLYQAILKESGVTSGPDGFGGLHIRGGSNDQNLILYDGVPVYNAGHALGLISLFNPYSVNNAHIAKDYFSSSEGGRLSSVVDVRMKEGNTKKLSGLLSVSTIASQYIIEGPLLKNRTGFMLSMRRSHIDPFFKQRSRAQKEEDFLVGESNFYFYDINAKIHHQFSSRDQVYLSFYKGQDRYNNEDILDDEYLDGYTYLNNEFKVGWGNQFTSLRWNHLFSDRLFGKLNLTQSQFNYASENYYYLEDYYSETDELVQDFYATDFTNQIKDLGARIDFDFYPNDEHKITFGSSFSKKRFTPGAISINQESYSGAIESDVVSEYINDEFAPLDYLASEWGLYGEDKWKISSKFSMILGLRWNLFQTDDPETDETFSYQAFQPRVILSYSLSDQTRMFASYNRMYQALHILNTSDIGFPNELWVPSSQNISPATSDQYSLGIRIEPSTKFKAGITIYQKEMNGLINFGDEAFIPSLTEYSPDFWTESVAIGEGKSLGLELDASIKTDRSSLRINYTYSKTQRRFDLINYGEWYDYSFDQNHVFDIGYRIELSKSFSIYSEWQYASGLAQTLINSPWKIQVLDNLSFQEGELLTEINDYRLPAYHRFNVNITYEWNWNKVNNRLQLGVQNAYNRKNVYYAYEVDDPDYPENNELIEQGALPLLPSLNYVISF